MDWKVGMRAKLVNAGVDSGKEGVIIISISGTLAFQIEGDQGFFPLAGLNNMLEPIDIEWKIGMRARLEKPNESIMTGVIHQNLLGVAVWMDDGGIWFYRLDDVKNYLYLIISDEEKVIVEVECGLCQRKNDSGYKTCWWCGTAGQ